MFFHPCQNPTSGKNCTAAKWFAIPARQDCLPFPGSRSNLLAIENTLVIIIVVVMLKKTLRLAFYGVGHLVPVILRQLNVKEGVRSTNLEHLPSSVMVGRFPLENYFPEIKSLLGSRKVHHD